MNKNKCLHIFATACLAVALAACTQDIKPEEAARQFVEGKMITRNGRYSLKVDDGVFAIIHVAMETRESSGHPWRAQETDISCKKMGESWVCSMALNKP